MADIDLDVTILRKGRREAVLQVRSDPDNAAKLRDILTGWLEGNRWGKGLWPEFTAEIRPKGEGRKLATVRPL